jgi:hypothetical protein
MMFIMGVNPDIAGKIAALELRLSARDEERGRSPDVGRNSQESTRCSHRA